MAEVHINANDIRAIVDSFKYENNTFVLKSFIDDAKKKTCRFFVEGKECYVDFYIKKKSVNILPVGKNPDECNLLVDYVASKGYDKNVETKQFVFSCDDTTVQTLVNFIEEECIGIVSCIKEGNIYRFKGYNGDTVTFTFYPESDKAMIQAKPFMAYGVVMTFLSGMPQYSFDQIVEFNNVFAGKNTPSSAIRVEMQNKLDSAYSYLDEALLKSISGSLALLKQKASCEDYTGCVAGTFKAIEGYLKKILVKKFGYKLQKHNTFSMFYKNGGQSKIDLNTSITVDEKAQLKKIYSIYSNKRNVYLHSTIDPSQTRIIATLKEAQDLTDEILGTIKVSYQVIFA